MPVGFFLYTHVATLRGPKRRQADFGNIRFPKADADPGFGPRLNCPKRCFSQRFWAFSFPEENFRSWNHGGRRPSIPAGTDGIGTVRPWAPALGSPGRPRPPHLSGLPRSPQARPARPGSDSSQRPAPEPGSGASLTRIKAQKGRSDRGSERPENCPVDSFQRRTGGSPGQL